MNDPARLSEAAGEGRVEVNCALMGFPPDAGHERTLHYVGQILEHIEESNVRVKPGDPAREWVMLKLVGGPHDGQIHTMPAACSEWSCRCGAWYK